METGPLKAGVAEMELDPPLGLAMGDGAPRAEGSLTPLYAKALVLSNGHAEVAIVTLDMLAIDGPDANRAAELVERRCGVPAGAIIMTCSHTHVAPSMLPTLHAYRKAFGPQFDDERTGGHLPTLYTPGCSENTNYFDYGKPGGLEKATEELASAIMAVQLETSCDPLIRLSFAREKMVLPIQDYSEFWSEPDVELKHPGALEAFAREAESLREEGAEGVEASSSPPGPVRC